ncbi:arsenate reductase ArsC [Sulfurospirillum sp. 1307]|jgi:arsenate reductase
MLKKVLFVCIHNNSRSQMAETLLKKYSEDLFHVESAGFELAPINPLVVRVLMEEENIDISHNSSDLVFGFFKQGKLFNYVIAVCDEGNAQRCPIFPGITNRLHWSFEDPSLFQGSEKEKYEKKKEVYLLIKQEVLKFIELIKKDTLDENFPSNWKVG